MERIEYTQRTLSKKTRSVWISNPVATCSEMLQENSIFTMARYTTENRKPKTAKAVVDKPFTIIDK
jgi:hypothetical protein